MDHNVCAEIPAPCCQSAIQSPRHADHEDVAPALIAVKQSEDEALRQNGHYNIAAQCVELAGYFCEVAVTQRKLFRKREITGDVLLAVLQFHGVYCPLKPCLVVVAWIAACGRVLCGRKFRSVYAGVCAEVVVKAVVFFNDDDKMLNWIVWLHTPLRTAQPVKSNTPVVAGRDSTFPM